VSRPADSIARDHTQAAFDTIAEVMRDPFAENRDRLAAAKLMIERGHGSAGQATIAVPMTKKQAAALLTMSDDELLAQIRGAALPRLRGPDVYDAEPHEVAESDPLLD